MKVYADVQIHTHTCTHKGNASSNPLKFVFSKTLLTQFRLLDIEIKK